MIHVFTRRTTRTLTLMVATFAVVFFDLPHAYTPHMKEHLIYIKYQYGKKLIPQNNAVYIINEINKIL